MATHYSLASIRHQSQMAYNWIRILHISTVIFTIAFFTLRLVWMQLHPHSVRLVWVRATAQINDTLLLLAGISLALMSKQYPFEVPWLTAKLIALVIYIILGSLALRWAKNRWASIMFGTLALICVGYIVLVAYNRSVTPWMLPST